MDEPASNTSMTEQDRQISEIIAEEHPGCAILSAGACPALRTSRTSHEVFCKLVEANRLLMPIDLLKVGPYRFYFYSYDYGELRHTTPTGRIAARSSGAARTHRWSRIGYNRRELRSIERTAPSNDVWRLEGIPYLSPQTKALIGRRCIPAHKMSVI